LKHIDFPESCGAIELAAADHEVPDSLVAGLITL
jgi:hypothetical protein